MIPDDYLTILLAFSIIVNACFIAVTLYDRYLERRNQRALDMLRHPAGKVDDEIMALVKAAFEQPDQRPRRLKSVD